MKYPYYNPNLHFPVLLKALFFSSKEADRLVKEYFRQLTGKKYVLVTNSCRTALYLSYKAIGHKGEVVTSPLTCKVAIDSIMESGNKPIFADIELGDLNIDSKDIEHRITKETIAIQAIHLGGVSCDMNSISALAKKNKLWVIEDCAQSLGAKYKERYTGSFGDVACFSLIKNAYGIGGGILATNSQEIYIKALELYEKFPNTSKLLTYYRVLRNFLETYRRTILGKLFYYFLIRMKGQIKSYSKIEGQLRKVPLVALKISAMQLKRIEKLHHCRKNIGKQLYEKLKNNGVLANHEFNPVNSSFTKLFIYNPNFEVIPLLEELHSYGIEAMHLEQKIGSPYQPKMINREMANGKGLKHYLKVHDSVISVPIREEFNARYINKLLEILK